MRGNYVVVAPYCQKNQIGSMLQSPPGDTRRLDDNTQRFTNGTPRCASYGDPKRRDAPNGLCPVTAVLCPDLRALYRDNAYSCRLDRCRVTIGTQARVEQILPTLPKNLRHVEFVYSDSKWGQAVRQLQADPGLIEVFGLAGVRVCTPESAFVW